MKQIKTYFSTYSRAQTNGKTSGASAQKCIQNGI